ncbi:hypothetical protein ABZP36_015239 [Zizania latifolia]
MPVLRSAARRAREAQESPTMEAAAPGPPSARRRRASRRKEPEGGGETAPEAEERREEEIDLASLEGERGGEKRMGNPNSAGRSADKQAIEDEGTLQSLIRDQCPEHNPRVKALTIPHSKLVDPKCSRTEVFDGFSAVFSPTPHSRSQCIITIRAVHESTDVESGKSLSNDVLTIADLAGAERERRTGNQGTRLLESNFIKNTSMVFGLCLKSLLEHQKNKKKPLEKHFKNSMACHLQLRAAPHHELSLMPGISIVYLCLTIGLIAQQII